MTPKSFYDLFIKSYEQFIFFFKSDQTLKLFMYVEYDIKVNFDI